MNSFKEVLQNKDVNHCPKQLILGLSDTMNAVSGKWKLPIITALFRGKNRFTDLQENIGRITPRMLSKELKELEINGIITRRVDEQAPNLIEYNLTVSGNKIIDVIDAMIDWGIAHRKETIR
jgi:DNA-binding HxlR family transcriptional regulator